MSRLLFDIVPLLPLAHASRQVFAYRAPPDTELAPGLLVRLPFGRRQATGIVWQAHRGKAPRPLRTVEKILFPSPLFTAEELVFLEKFSEATLAPLSAVTQSAAFVRLPLTASRAHATLPSTPHQHPSRTHKKATTLRASVSWTPLADALPRTNEGQQLVLVPERHLEQQVRHILSSRGVTAVSFAQTQRVRERRALLERLLSGEPLAVVATRAGIFLPLPRLSAIMVMEAALDAHRQWDLHPRYDSRVGALLLAHARGVPLTLQSTLPSLDLLTLSKDTVTNRAKRNGESWSVQPRSPADPLLSASTLQTIKETLEQRGRVFLFHDLAGTERAFTCETCGHRLSCKHCGGVLERLTSDRTLSCRQCEVKGETLPHFCPQCKSPHLRATRAGTTTLTWELQRQLRDCPIDRLDRETLPRLHPPAYHLPEHGPYLLLGTERAFAVLPERAFEAVIVISADRLLEDRSYAAAERFVQLLWRLAAVGREGVPRILQTTHPHLLVVRSVTTGDLAAWTVAEQADREALSYPPAVALIRLERGWPSLAPAERHLRTLLTHLGRHRPSLTTGSQIAPVAGQHRAEVQIRGPLRLLRDVVWHLPSGWDHTPYVPLSLLTSATDS